MSYLIYRFHVANDTLYEHKVPLSFVTTDAQANESSPMWTKLEFHQCPNCTLNKKCHLYCPVAIRLPPLIDTANRLSSYDQIKVEVVHDERCISQVTTAQRALSSLLGLVMATSNCPHTVYLQPMARFHLPMANEIETVYRVASMYLLAQYFLHREGYPVDFTLDGLKRIYRELQRINLALSDRIRAASSQDTANNAIVLLDLFAKVVPYSIEDAMSEYRELFSAYLPDRKHGDDLESQG